MADDSNFDHQDLLKVKIDGSLSPKELEAEIAASASTIGEAKTVAGKTVHKTSFDKPKVINKQPVPKKPKSVKTSNESKAIKAEPKEVKLIKIKDKVQASSSDNKVDKQAVVLSRHGKDLQPIGDVVQLKKAQAMAIPKRAPAVPEKTEKNLKLPSKSSIHTEKPYPVIKKMVSKDPIAPKSVQSLTRRDAPQFVKTSTKSVIDHPKIIPPRPPVKVKADKHTPHVARIYDTKTYHMPISVDHHSRKAALPMWGQILILVIGLAGMLIVALLSGFIEL